MLREDLAKADQAGSQTFLDSGIGRKALYERRGLEVVFEMPRYGLDY